MGKIDFENKEQLARANTNNVFLDKLVEKLGLKNDAAAARALEVAPPVISKMRYGHLPFGPGYVIRAHELTGWTIREIKAMLGQASLELQVPADPVAQ